jgi:hypothetical protein
MTVSSIFPVLGMDANTPYNQNKQIKLETKSH